ncbi:MAG TPA: CusA/CzcA family heavy metal efflux RND transporter [Myxococcales bacterium]|nr:CusA/CzcA family heavy metal efflux RND transporter [Myxococcales bacterium]
MIDWILRTSLRHRVFVVAAAVLLTVFGAYRLRQMPVDVFPDLSAPRVTIVTEATGLAPTEVEQLITFPLETAVNGVAGTRRVRSASAAGISIVWVEFDWDTPGSIARQRVTERLQAAAASLPPEADPPVLAPPSSVMGEIAFISLSGDELDTMELRRIAERDVRRRLLAVDGVSQVVALGGDERQYQVLLDPERLTRFALTGTQVADAIEAGSANAPGGYLVQAGQESVVRVLGRAGTAEQIGAIRVTAREGVPVRVRDVAEVRVGPAVRRGTGSYNARPAVILSVVKQPAADTLATTALVDEALDELEPELTRRGVVLDRDLFRQSVFIETSVDNLMDVLRDGAILVAIILFLFLWHPGATVISVLAIPLSLLSATLALEAFGLSLDTMTLGGLAIAIGELVDDAIIDVENIARRLRERSQLEPDERPPVLETVLVASREIRSSIVSATAVLLLVFTPLLFLGGIEGRLLRPLAISYLVAILASLFVAVTVTPVLSSWLLPRRSARTESKEPPLQRWLHRAYEPALRFSVGSPRLVAALAIVFVIVGVGALAGTGRSFLPEFNEGSLNIAMVVLPGTSLEESDALGRLAEEALLSDPAVVSTTRRTGRAERNEHVQGPEASEMDVLLRVDDERSREEILDDLRDKLSVVPGANFTFGQPISHRIDHMLSGQRSALTVRVVGQDLDAARRTAAQVRDAIDGIDGLVDLQVEPIVDTPQVVIDIDEPAAARHGLSRGEASRAVGLALWGREVGRVFEDSASTDIVVRYGDDVRSDRERIAGVRVPTPSGAAIPLSALADIQTDRAPNYIMRENVRRRVVVTANVSGRDLRSVAQEMRAAVGESVAPPPGIRIEYAGQFEQEEEASQRLLLLGLLVVLGIGLIVGATLRSGRRTAIVLANLPLALAGGVVGVYLGGGVMSIATTIGFITLFGIATRNGILLATRTADLEQSGMPREEAVLISSRERLSPILMTAVTAALGLLPLALAIGEPGAEIQAPMALVIVTGLVSSTLLNMVVVPALLSRWGGTLQNASGASPNEEDGSSDTGGDVA